MHAWFLKIASVTNLSHDSLNPAHVTYWWVNNPTLGEFGFTMIGRADIKGLKSNVAMIAWLPQASYLCDNFADTYSLSTNVCMFVCLPQRLSITSGVIWYDIDPIRLVE